MALLVLSAVGVGIAPAPAQAAYCAASGVHVQVDFRAQGGGVQQGCAALSDGRMTGDRAFPAAGFPLTYVSSQPGAVCRVSGKPASAGCAQMPPADAYWGLFESHGGGGWSYAQTGVGGVRLEPGDSVAFVWQDGGDLDRPGVAPGPANFPKPTPTTKPQPTPKPQPTTKPQSASKPTKAGGAATSAAPTAEADSPSASTSPSASASASSNPSAPATASRRPSATASPTDDVTQAAAPAESLTPRGDAADEGLPGWVPVGLVVGLSGAAAAAVAVRRRSL